MYRKPDVRRDVQKTDSRRIWVRPAVSRMKAGDAEVGPNPDNADGGFTFS
jgi:hypothetical protein